MDPPAEPGIRTRNGPSLIANGKFEVRGWTSIGIYESETKSVDLLLNPEQRGTYFPQSLQTAGDPVDESKLSQTAVKLEVASGQGRTKLTPGANADILISAKVSNWANQNSVDIKLLAPFAKALDCLL